MKSQILLPRKRLVLLQLVQSGIRSKAVNGEAADDEVRGARHDQAGGVGLEAAAVGVFDGGGEAQGGKGRGGRRRGGGEEGRMPCSRTRLR